MHESKIWYSVLQGGDDFFGILLPRDSSSKRRTWDFVGFGHKAVDGGLKVCDGFEDTAFQPSPRQLGEIAFHGIEPRIRSRREVEGEALMPGKPR